VLRVIRAARYNTDLMITHRWSGWKRQMDHRAARGRVVERGGRRNCAIDGLYRRMWNCSIRL